MKKEITLRSAKEMLGFFKSNPDLTFVQMNKIVHSYSGGEFTAIVFKPKGNKERSNDERLKQELLDWLEKYGEALDNGEVAHFFSSTFPKNSN